MNKDLVITYLTVNIQQSTVTLNKMTCSLFINGLELEYLTSIPVSFWISWRASVMSWIWTAVIPKPSAVLTLSSATSNQTALKN